MNLQDPKSLLWPVIAQISIAATTTICCIFLYKNGLVAKDGVLMLTNAAILYAVYLLKSKMTT